MYKDPKIPFISVVDRRPSLYSTPPTHTAVNSNTAQPLIRKTLSIVPTFSRHTSISFQPPGLVSASPTNKNRDRKASSLSSIFHESLNLYHSWLNLLLLLTAIGLILTTFDKKSSTSSFLPVITFVCIFLGMIPLATLLGKATEIVAEHTNDTIGALVNVTFGNAVELILSIAAMRANRIHLVQDTIVGSILSNLLLVLGSSFFVGGTLYKEQEILQVVSENNANMLLFAVFGFSVPALFSVGVPETRRPQKALENLSLITAIVLLSIYIMFMVFQLHTHADLYNTKQPKSTNSNKDKDNNNAASASDSFPPKYLQSELKVGASSAVPPASESDRLLPSATATAFPSINDEERNEEPPSLIAALIVLGITIFFVTLSSEVLVDRIDEFSNGIGLRQKFIAIVLLPVVANAVEHMSAIMVAGHNKIDMSIGIACGSSLQMALFVAPLLVVLSWVFRCTHLCLNFEVFETVCMGFTVLLVNATLRDSRSNWLEGALLLLCYFILISAFYFVE